jgi:Uma2 family endonuclease
MASERQAHQIDAEYSTPRRVSVEEYLRAEAAAETRHEYWQGWMYSRMYPPGSLQGMAGGTLAHARLIVRLLTTLEAHLGQGPCVVYPGDVRLYVHEHQYFYPDVFVTCGGTTDAQALELRTATMVAEVLSPSTAAFDQGDKLDAYAQIKDLREYLLLDSRRIQATVFRRAQGGQWMRLVSLNGADLSLESLAFRLPMAQLYRGVPLDADPEREDRPS